LPNSNAWGESRAKWGVYISKARENRRYNTIRKAQEKDFLARETILEKLAPDMGYLRPQILKRPDGGEVRVVVLVGDE